MMKIIELEDYLKIEFQNCSDFEIRETLCGAKVFCLRMLTDKQYTSEKILKPLNSSPDAGLISLNALELSNCDDFKKVCYEMLHGGVAVCFPDGSCVACGADRQSGRSVSEPDTEVTVYGAHAGFVEAIDTNLSMVRKLIRVADLKIENFTIGNLTATPISVVYMKSQVKPELVINIREKLKKASLRAVYDSGNIAMLLEDKRQVFTTTGKSEKVNKVAAQILSGRIAIFVDGSPFVITLPYVFSESLQATEDYIKTTATGTFVRCLRFLALLISLYLPAVFTAAAYSPVRLIPLEIMMALTENKSNIAFGIFGELLVALLIFEIVREVGLRMPKAVGDSVGILASIILGDAAVRAGLVSSVAIMIVALSAVANFAVPAYKDSGVLLRFVLLISAYALSFSGIALVTIGLLVLLVETDSFGTPYMTSIAPISKQGLKDFLLIRPKEKMSEGDSGITRNSN